MSTTFLPIPPIAHAAPEVTSFFDSDSNTFSYIVKDPDSSACAIIDPVRDFDYASGHMHYRSADQIIDTVTSRGLAVEWIIETHVHADHVTAAPYLKARLGGKIGIGEHISTVQQTFATVFNETHHFLRDGSQFDQLFADGDTYQVGGLTFTAIHTPGHTPACMTHIVGDAAFVGDTIFMPDSGTARADFPGGDARVLYNSIQRILSLPDETRLFLCHDYPPETRDVTCESSVAAQKAENIHVKNGTTEAAYVQMREARDKTLAMPTLILPSLQVNMRAGELPAADDNGRHYLRVPINAFHPES